MYGFSIWKSECKNDFEQNYEELVAKLNPFDTFGINYSKHSVLGYNLLMFYPTDTAAVPLLQYKEYDKYAILMWGELFCSSTGSIDDINFRLNNNQSIEDMNGNYSLVIFNKEDKKIYITSDFLGRRKIYYSKTKCLAISNLDHLLIPFIEGEVKYDKTSILSSLCFDWSLGGKSYIDDINVTNPDYVFVFDSQSICLRKINYAINSAKSEDVEVSFHSYLKHYIENIKEVHLDLTAGLDTRTILALLIKYFNKKLIAWTMGVEGMDVSVSRKIAKYFNIEHRSSSSKLADINEFELHAKFLAYIKNGDTNSYRGLNKIEYDVTRRIPKVIGIYGTVSKGKYYFGKMTCKKYEEKIFEDRNSIPFIGMDKQEELRSRLDSLLEQLSFQYSNYFQEMFYIRERCGNWGGVVFNSTWNLKHISPFEDIRSIQNNLSAPLKYRMTSQIQHKILYDASKYLYFLPVNQNIFNNGFANFLPDNVRTFGRKAFAFVQRKLKKKNRTTFDIQAERKRLFKEYSEVKVIPLIRRKDSCISKIFNSDEIEQIVMSYLDNGKYFDIIHKAYSMEIWKQYVDEMATLKYNSGFNS
jgi:hypothetical protein